MLNFIKNFINENISNDQLLILAGYGFIMCIYQSLHILSNLKADDVMPKSKSFLVHEENTSSENTPSSSENTPSSSENTPSSSENTPSSSENTPNIPEINLGNLRKRRRNLK